MDRFFLGEYVASVFSNVKVAFVYKKVFKNKFFEDTAVIAAQGYGLPRQTGQLLQWLLTEE